MLEAGGRRAWHDICVAAAVSALRSISLRPFICRTPQRGAVLLCVRYGTFRKDEKREGEDFPWFMFCLFLVILSLYGIVMCPSPEHLAL